MRVKIVKCSNPEWWYEDEIDKVFDVVQAQFEDGRGRLLKANEDWEVDCGYMAGAYILKSDCEIIPEQEARSDDRH